MTGKKLTIGMACYDDFDGVYFTILSIKLHHKEIYDQLEFVVIDNNPTSAHGIQVEKFLKNELPTNHQYIPYTDKTTSFTKYKVFDYAQTPYVIIMDCHVLLEKGVLRRLLKYYENHPNTKNLLQGPIIMNNITCTEMKPIWRGNSWGIWHSDPRGLLPNNKPYEIEMQGMGFMTCRKIAWPGVNPLFKGFGAEEGYIQGKFKKAGAKTLCLPFLRWHHRFGRPEGTNFKVTLEDRIRNYCIGFDELGYNKSDIINHFKTQMKPENVDAVYQKYLKEIKK